MPRLRGRDAEVFALANSLASVQAGRSGIIRITGAAGSGKTRLLAHVMDQAHRQGIKTFHASADRSVSYDSLPPLLDALMFDPEPILVDNEVRRLRQSSGQQFWLLRAIQAALEDASRDRPLVIAIDDLQWCDDLTLMAMRAIPSRLSASPILWIVTARQDLERSQVVRTAGVLSQVATTSIDLAPLHMTDIGLIAMELLGATPDEAVVALAARTDRSPLQIVELLTGLVDEGSVERKEGVAWLLRDDIPLRFKDLIGARARRLSATSSKYLKVAATLGHRFDPEHLARLVGDSPAALLTPLREAIEAGFLIEQPEGLSFRHELVRECLENDLPMSLRRGLARRLVDIRLQDGALPHEVATAVASCAEHGDRQAVQLLREAYRSADHPEAPEAIAWSEDALRILPGGSELWPEVALEAALLMHHAGHPDRAREIATLALERNSAADLESEILLILGRIEARIDLRAGWDRYRQAASVPGVSTAQSLRVSAHLLEHRCRTDPSLSGADLGAEELRAATQCGDSQSAGFTRVCLGRLAVSRMNWASGLEVLERCACRAAGACGVAGVEYLHLLNACGQGHQAITAIDNHLDLTGGRTGLPELTLRRAARARFLVDVGQIAEGEAAAHLATDSSGLRASEAAELKDARLALAHVALHTGDGPALERARLTAVALLNDGTASNEAVGMWLAARLADASGDAALAAELATRVFDPVVSSESSAIQPLDELHLVQIFLQVDDLSRALLVVQRAERRVELNPGFAMFETNAHLVRGVLENDSDRLTHTVTLLEAAQLPLLLAAARECLAGALYLQHPERAIYELESALETYDVVGARRHSARVRKSLRGLGVRKHHPTDKAQDSDLGLTTSEQRVVDLVAAGSSNRETAARLSLSVHTVSTHLRHAFEKLGINSRVELARLMDQHERTA